VSAVLLVQLSVSFGTTEAKSFKTRNVSPAFAYFKTIKQTPSKDRIYKHLTQVSKVQIRRKMSVSDEKDTMTIEQIYDHMGKQGKQPMTVSNKVFLLTAGIGVPLWIGGLLPLAIATTLGKKMLSASSVPSLQQKSETTNDDEVFPSFDNITPMEERKYDIVLFGATGFAGKLAIEHLVKTYGVNKDVKWAIAGRSKDKLEDTKAKVADLCKENSILEVDTIIADTSSRSTLHDLVKDTKVVATTAGPFQAYGGADVIEFCAKYGTDYVDITGEVDWHKEMIMKWDETAQKTGAKIVSFCGNDSIPWDMTVYKMGKVLKEECNDDLSEVQLFDDFKGDGPSGGTLATVLLAVDGKAFPKQAYNFNPLYKKADGTKSKFSVVGENVTLPGRVKGVESFSKNYEGPFVMSAINMEVVKRSHALRSEGNQKLVYRESLLSKDFKTAFLNWFGLIGFGTLLFTPIRGWFLPKPGEGPSRKRMEAGYLTVAGFGVGSKGNKVETLFYFPKETGYLDTARMLVESGLCLAMNKKDLPVTKGGFYTPSTSMGDALMNRLCKTGCMFASKSMKIQSKL